MTDEELAKCEYHLKHMPMSALRLRIETLSAAVSAMTGYVEAGFECPQIFERLDNAVAILSDLVGEYNDIVQCTEICNMDDCPELEARRDE